VVERRFEMRIEAFASVAISKVIAVVASGIAAAELAPLPLAAVWPKWARQME
jgi:hypothetical protein